MPAFAGTTGGAIKESMSTQPGMTRNGYDIRSLVEQLRAAGLPHDPSQ
jgi:hypothetical protein